MGNLYRTTPMDPDGAAMKVDCTPCQGSGGTQNWPCYCCNGTGYQVEHLREGRPPA